MKKVRLVEVKSEIAAGTRGASMGPDAIKIAALDYGSNLFKKIDSIFFFFFVLQQTLYKFSYTFSIRLYKSG